jgi:hypothetical protein
VKCGCDEVAQLSLGLKNLGALQHKFSNWEKLEFRDRGVRGEPVGVPLLLQKYHSPAKKLFHFAAFL